MYLFDKIPDVLAHWRRNCSAYEFLSRTQISDLVHVFSTVEIPKERLVETVVNVSGGTRVNVYGGHPLLD